jgi:transposase
VKFFASIADLFLRMRFTLAGRQAYSVRIVDRTFAALQVKRDQIPERSSLGEAIRYALGQDAKLRAFLTNAFEPIDTNAVESAIRPFVVGRKNWMFSGSPRGADSGALVYSLIETAKVNGLEPWMYLWYLFAKLPLCQNDNEMRALLPRRPGYRRKFSSPRLQNLILRNRTAAEKACGNKHGR